MNAPLPSHVDPQAIVAGVLSRHVDEPGALMPILHDVQEALGFIPAIVVPEIARALNLSRAEVHGVITYYHHFRDHPTGRHVVQVCRAESCKSMGADALIDHAATRLGCALHETSADGRYTLEPAYCLGLCALSPTMMIGTKLHARLTPARFDALVARLENDA